MYEVGIPPPWWWDADDATVATLLVLLGEQHDRMSKARKRKGR